MSRIFLSHSSANNAEAIALAGWLATNGWTDVFLDLDPTRGIAAGEHWKRRLYEAADRCEAVLFLVTPAWLASEWCKREFELAAKLKKQIYSSGGSADPEALYTAFRGKMPTPDAMMAKRGLA